MRWRAWTIRTIAAAGILLLAGAPARAQHKCVGADGRTSYSQLPCVSGAKPAAIRSGASAGLGGEAAPAYEYYDVTGDSHAALLSSLTAGAGGPHFARAEWKLSYEYRWRVLPSGCGVESVTTRLVLGVRMPRWTAASGARGELAARWDRFIAALKVHEEGHLAHGRGAEQEVKAAFSTMTAPDCGTLDGQLRARFARIIEDYSARDREYDRATGHGRTQGAVF